MDIREERDFDEKSFRKILARNVSLPLLLGVGVAAVFSGLILYLLSVNRWIDRIDQSVARTNLLLKLIVDSETGMRGFAATRDEQFLEPYDQAWVPFEDTLRELRQEVTGFPAQEKNLDRIEESYRAWRQVAANIIRQVRSNPEFRGQAEQLQGKQRMDGIRLQFSDLLQEEQTRRTARVLESERTVRFSMALMLLTCVGFSAFLAIAGRRQLIFLSQSYGAIMKKEREQADVLREQDWLKSGQNQLNQTMLGQHSLTSLSSLALEHTAAYLGAKVGALYSLEHDKTLRRLASYALPETELPETIPVGESIAGQAVLSRNPIRLDSLPENYLTIRSSLGGTAPRCVVVTPLSADGSINGVIELGFLDGPMERGEAYLGQAATHIGNALKTALYRWRLEQLLEETQRQSEELQAQQEELRVANEELETQTHAMAQKQTRLETQQTELEQINRQLEEQAQILETQKSDLDDKNEALTRSQGALSEKAQELERANRYKSEFLANMSHELRTPLNSSLILAKLLVDNPAGNLTPEQVEFADTIYSAGNDLLNLINDILDLSKVEAGRIEIHPQSVAIDDLLEGLERQLSPLAKSKNLELTCQALEGAPPAILTDRQRLEQILKNLLSNALKFTELGSVKLTVARVENGLSFTIADTGIGIPLESQEVIFEAFRQADGTTNRKYGGTGLGLSISRELARLMGGDIRVKSAPEKGSTFTVWLPEILELPKESKPLAAKEETALPPSAQAVPESKLSPRPPKPFLADDREALDKKSRTLLVVEDEPGFARLLYDVAHERGFKCVVAPTAREALALTRELGPQAILLDVKLPDQSGLALLDSLKADPQSRHIPVHVISGFDYSEMALRLGAVGYLIKPFETADLKKAFIRLEHALSQRVHHVLVVEDNQPQRQSICRLIEGENVEVRGVETATEALELLSQQSFDCMVVDLVLPDMSGYELLERMSQDPKAALPPVVVYTGRDLTNDEELRLRKYSHSVVIKGARSPERLLNEVSLFLHQVESSMPPERQAMLKSLRDREKLFQGRTVLIVDDDVRNIFALTSVIEQKGAKVLVARNGKEALTQLDSHADIDLVLMDVMMPEMDGLTAIRELRKREKLAKLPVIAITAKAMANDHQDCLRAGANDYLSKPVHLEKLLSLMRVWMPRPTET